MQVLCEDARQDDAVPIITIILQQVLLTLESDCFPNPEERAWPDENVVRVRKLPSLIAKSVL